MCAFFLFFFRTKLLIHKPIVTLNTGNEHEKNRETRTTQRRARKKRVIEINVSSVVEPWIRIKCDS